MFCNRFIGYGYGGGGMFLMMGFGFLIFLALIFLAFKLMKGNSPLSSSNNSTFSNNSALNILNERFAKGEINEEEYTKRKQILNQKN